jgi:diaminopimelate epimerase
MPLRFSKMHGLGNDFAVLDRRDARMPLQPALIRRMGDRRRGIGFDQLLTLEPPTRPEAAFRYGVWNADGSAAGQCGNGVRCVVAWLARAGAWPGGLVPLEAPGTLVTAELLADGQVRIDMGVPEFQPSAIPFQAERAADSYAIEVAGSAYVIGAVALGNPHAVLEVGDVDTAPVAALGASLEAHQRFPERCNVGFAQVLGPDSIRLRVFERGTGETLACGSGACAAVAVLAKRRRLGPSVRVALPGGELKVSWAGDGESVWMQGPAEFVYEGEWQT